MATKKGKDLESEYVVLDPKGVSKIWKSNAFWKMAFDPSHKDNKPSMGYLVSQYEFDKDWESWEKHPKGDEIVFCISGEFTVVLDLKSGHKETHLKSGQFCVIPKNTWHTVKIKKTAKALFITWGYGTQHKEV